MVHELGLIDRPFLLLLIWWLRCKGIPTPSGLVSVSGSITIGIHCDAWVTLENRSQTHSQTSQCTQWNQFDAAADARCGYSLRS